MTEAEYIGELRQILCDEDGSKNILNKKLQQYTDAQLAFFLKRAIRDANGGIPRTDFTLETFPEEDLVLNGAVVFACISEGLLQLRNQTDYSDAGLSISLFNKTAGYQGWAGFLLQSYVQDKQDFKRGILANQHGAGFYGIRSQFSIDWGIR